MKARDILRHSEPVIAAAWGMIGPMQLVTSTDGQPLYAGSAKLFTQAIYECLDPEFSEVDSHELTSTCRSSRTQYYHNCSVRCTMSYEVKTKKRKRQPLQNSQPIILQSNLWIKRISKHARIASMNYTSNSDGVLNPVTSVTDEDSAETLLLLEKGLASILNTQDKTVDRAVAILTAKLSLKQLLTSLS